ncbi:MAG: PilN domain-containing protein [Candidatus Wallbacteria bacterium]|nr:PilN domain-containing protein [Candidatus Wallbacteria bacterium]
MSDELHFELLPRDRHRGMRRRDVLVSLAVTALALAMAAAILSVAATKSRELSTARQGFHVARAYRTKLDSLRQAEGRLQAGGLRLEQLASQRAFDAELLAELAAQFRDRAWLAELRYDSSAGILNLGGYCLKTRHLPELMAALWKTGRLADIRTVVVSRRQFQGHDVVWFVLSARPVRARERAEPSEPAAPEGTGRS